MSRAKELLLVAVVTLALAVGALMVFGGLDGGSAQAEPLQKVLVQHFTGSETNPYEIICISENALDAHEDEHLDILILLGGCETEGPIPE